MKRKRGLMVVLLGPDGSGKTSVADMVSTAMGNEFHDIHRFYFRPGLLPFPGVFLGLREDIQTGTNPSPHGHGRQNPIKSFLRFFYYLMDFVFGYWVGVHPMVKEGALVIFDRYYYDYLIDPFRYQMTLPKWLISSLLPIVPKPDVIIYLEANPEKLLERKQEIAYGELVRQSAEYFGLVKRMKMAKVVDTGDGLERTVERVLKEIRDGRTKKK